MSINALISLFGSVYLTVPMLLDSLELPTDLFQLYMVSSLLTSRFTSLLAAMNIFLLAVGGTAMLAGIAKISMRKLIIYSALTPLVFLITIGGSSMLLSKMISSEYVMDEVVMNMKVSDKTPILNVVEEPVKIGKIYKPRNIQEIIKSGVLRVGFNPDQVPFSYYNIDNKLVGFDVELVNELVEELGIAVEFIPYELTKVVKDLNRGKIDFAISGVQVTTKRIQYVNFTNPILNLHYCVVVRDHRAKEFDVDGNLKDKELKIATVGNYSIMDNFKNKFPKVEFIKIGKDKEFFQDIDSKYDGLLISLEAGKAWTLLYPEYTSIYRKDLTASFPASYALSQSNISLLNFMNSWLELQKGSGKIDSLYDYWIQGHNASPKQPRWSIAKDVLHWIK